MATGSIRYRSLAARFAQLRKNLLGFVPDPPVSQLRYSEAELDATRAYIVLAHAEIEAFCEQIALAKVIAAKAAFDNRQAVSPCLRRIICYQVGSKHESWSEVLNPPVTRVESAFNFYQTLVRDNHGIKRRNLHKIFFPIGIVEADFNPTWIAQMDSFGLVRGGWAHGSIATLRPPDPLTQLQAGRHLMVGLLALDRVVARLR